MYSFSVRRKKKSVRKNSAMFGRDLTRQEKLLKNKVDTISRELRRQQREEIRQQRLQEQAIRRLERILSRHPFMNEPD